MDSLYYFQKGFILPLWRGVVYLTSRDIISKKKLFVIWLCYSTVAGLIAYYKKKNNK